MKLVTTLANDDLNAVPARVAAAEAAGWDGVSVAENAHNPFLPLAVAAVNTERIELATAVAIAFPRSPMMMANCAWDLQAASGGRFVLGIGSQIKAHNERRFSTPWSAPAPRMREYIGALRAIFECWASGGDLDFDGDFYSFNLMTPNFRPAPLDGPLPPIKISAVGPAMLRLAGEAADGVSLHPFCTRSYVENQILPRLEEGMVRTGRRREAFEISGGGFVATGATEAEVAEMVEWVRFRIAFYGSTRAYWPVLAEHGLEELGSELNRLSKRNEWDEMASLVSDDVIALFCAVASHDGLAAAIDERFGGVCDAVGIPSNDGKVAELPSEVIAAIHDLPTVFTGWS